MFKDLQKGDIVYILDINPASGVPTYESTSIVSVVPEYAPNGNVTAAKVMDIVCKLGVEDKTLAQINPQSTYVSVGSYKISTDKSWLMDEIRAIHDNNKRNIESVGRYEAIVEACAEILQNNGLSPESDSQRLSSLENSVNRVERDMSDIKNMLSTLVGELKPTYNEQSND